MAVEPLGTPFEERLVELARGLGPGLGSLLSALLWPPVRYNVP